MTAGLQVAPCSQFEACHMALVRWAPSAFFHRHWHLGGEEIFVMGGIFEDEYQSYPAGS